MYHRVENIEYKQTEYGMKTVVTMDTFFEPNERMILEDLQRDIISRFIESHIPLRPDLSNIAIVLKDRILSHFNQKIKKVTDDEFEAQLEAMKEQAYRDVAFDAAEVAVRFIYEHRVLLEKRDMRI